MLTQEQLIEAIKLLRPFVTLKTEHLLSIAVEQGANFGELTAVANDLRTTEIALLWAVKQYLSVLQTSAVEYSKVIRVERGKSSGSNSPKWTMDTDNGTRFWVFEHTDPERNTITAFNSAGWGHLLKSMLVGETWKFEQTPIEVQLVKEGTYHRPLHVKPMPEGATHDQQAEFNTQAPTDRILAVDGLKGITSATDWYIIDTETTGLSFADEVVKIAVINGATNTICINAFVKPTVAMTVGAQSVNNITEADYADAPAFPDVWNKVKDIIQQSPVLAWNAEFDVRMIQQSLKAHGKSDAQLSLTCAMDAYAAFNGEWDAKRKKYKSVSLVNACAQMGVSLKDAHESGADALATAEIVKLVANTAKKVEELPF